MTTVEKIAIVNMVVSAVMNSMGWLISWRISKSANQTALLKANPDAKPTAQIASKSTLQVAEGFLVELNRIAKRLRRNDLIVGLLIVGTIMLYYFSNRSRFILVETVITLTLAAVSVVVSVNLWPQIKRLKRALIIMIEALSMADYQPTPDTPSASRQTP